MTMPPLDPEIAAALAEAPYPAAYLDETNLEDARQHRLALLADVELSEAVERQDLSVPGPGPETEVVIRVHRPRDVPNPAPCLFSIHGGGYVMGTLARRCSRDVKEWLAQMIRSAV